MTSELTIRKASFEDAGLIRDMAEVVFRKTYQSILSSGQMEYMMDWMYSKNSLMEQMGPRAHQFFIAFSQGTACGYMSIHEDGYRPEGTAVFHLEKLYVMPFFQGKGAGSALFRTALAYVCEQCGAAIIELNVNRYNPAVGFYKKMGMQISRQGDFPIGEGFFMNDYIMSIEVNAKETDMNYEERAQTWLSGNFDEETKKEIIALRDSDPAAFEDAFYRNLEFGTGGLRGIMGVGTNRMNKYTVGMATQGLANYILSHADKGNLRVCVSFDSRNNSRSFAQITADVLSANGIDVFIFEGIRPTPELSYSIRAKKAIAGVMVTASHNPKEYNGYKVFWSDGGQITSPVDKDIVDEVNKITDASMVRFTPGENCGKIQTMGAELDEEYLRDILSLTLSPESRERHKDLKFVYTPLHGCGVRLVPECLRRLGFENVFHVPEQDVNDGNFPTVLSPNPEEPSALKMAIEVAEKNGADVVMATDPDADRMGIALRDNDGNMVLFNGNQTASLLTYYLLSKWKEQGRLNGRQYVVKTIVTTELMAEICKSFGVKIYNVLTGFKYIAETVKRNEAGTEFICGAEESYGFNAGQYVRDKDAQIACSLLAECCAWAADQGLTLFQLMQKIYSEYGYRKEGLMSVVRKGKSGAEEIQNIMSELRSNPPAELCGSKVCEIIDYLEPEKTGQPKSNVLQFFDEDGDVVSVRPSGTEPKIKFYFGAKGADADEKIEKLKAQFSL